MKSLSHHSVAVQRHHDQGKAYERKHLNHSQFQRQFIVILMGHMLALRSRTVAENYIRVHRPRERVTLNGLELLEAQSQPPGKHSLQ